MDNQQNTEEFNAVTNIVNKTKSKSLLLIQFPEMIKRLLLIHNM